MRRILVKSLMLIATAVTALSFTACSSGSADPADFAAEAAGVWYLYGNSLKDSIEVREDGTWTRQTPEGDTTDEGTITYYESGKEFEFSSNSGARVSVELEDGEVLYYEENFYRAEHSVPGFQMLDGSWYLDGDPNSQCYVFDSSYGVWQYFETADMASSSENWGYLEWYGAESKFLAWETSDEKPFAEFEYFGGDSLTLDGDTYTRIAGNPAEE
jgi:hypothetical protein